MMNRRNASKLILTGSLATPALIRPSALAANPKEDDENARIAEAARPVIRVAAQRVVLEWFVIRTLNGWTAMNLQREFRQHNERRGSLGGVLGRFQRQTVDQRLKTAQAVGNVYLASQIIFLLPLASINRKAFDAQITKMEVDLYHEYLSWDLEAAFRVAALGNRSAESIRAEARQVGVAFLTGTLQLMLMVNPVINRKFTLGS